MSDEVTRVAIISGGVDWVQVTAQAGVAFGAALIGGWLGARATKKATERSAESALLLSRREMYLEKLQEAAQVALHIRRSLPLSPEPGELISFEQFNHFSEMMLEYFRMREQFVTLSYLFSADVDGKMGQFKDESTALVETLEHVFQWMKSFHYPTETKLLMQEEVIDNQNKASGGKELVARYDQQQERLQTSCIEAHKLLSTHLRDLYRRGTD